MKKVIAIIAGEPNSISSEIIFKSWNLKKKYSSKLWFVIGSINLLNLQKKKLKYKIKINEINENFDTRDLKGPSLPVYNIDYHQKKPFEKISTKSNKYIFKCFDSALKFSKNKKTLGFINCPISKEFLFKNKHQGVTEYLAHKTGSKNKEVMLIFNKKLSVSPITTHISLSLVSKKINQHAIIKKVKVINEFYKKNFKKKPIFAILGLNPHNSPSIKKSEEKEVINKAINSLQRSKINVQGPISPDSAFVIYKKYKFDVIVGMYHDQVLSPFKTLYNFNAINITLGLPYIRISTDHGIAKNIVGKKVANPESLIESIKFFNNIK